MVAQQMNGVQSETVTLTVSVREYTTPSGKTARGFPESRLRQRDACGVTRLGMGRRGRPELVKFRGGETVVPNHVAQGYAGRAGSFPDQHVHVYLDGREIYTAVQKQAIQAQRRNGPAGLAMRTR